MSSRQVGLEISRKKSSDHFDGLLTLRSAQRKGLGSIPVSGVVSGVPPDTDLKNAGSTSRQGEDAKRKCSKGETLKFICVLCELCASLLESNPGAFA